MLDFEFLAPDPGGFVPMYLSQMDRAIRQPNAGDSFAFSPATAPIEPSQPSDFADSDAVANVSIPEISAKISNRIEA